ncbi:ATP-grasp domain-containing protein [Ruminococcus flavefaciens]|uniref:ATP-grasp domain-containing protein n=1 Tax=Ruminococcus flavefaciens TaxID=1265 RepID=UPI0004915150|nr:ATP-grasp domain-containing protein [Ruminococcus flavefaciens]
MKKLMILGGSAFILPVIEKAHQLGCYVITCDYLPDNIAHKYSDEYCNVSVIDKEAVLEAAKKHNVDGIISFACDPGVASAAYAADKMGLPFQGPYESVKILQDKGLFRKFLTDNGFNCPHSKSYSDKNAPFNDIDFFDWPVIVKPVDSAGSKGVTRVDDPAKLPEAIEIALDCGHNGQFIIEDFITFKGFHSDGDFFTVDGKIVFGPFADQLFDKQAVNPYTPAMLIWPATMSADDDKALHDDLQRLMDLLNMKTGIYNIEACVGANGKPYIMEVSPRGGGCRIAEIQNMAYGENADLIENEIRKAVGLPLTKIEEGKCDGHWVQFDIHSDTDRDRILKAITIDPEIEKNNVKYTMITAKAGDVVKPFTGANMTLGDLFLRFDTREELDKAMSDPSQWLKIEYQD